MRLAKTLIALALVFPTTVQAQDVEVGRTGWQLERLSETFVLLRSEIFDSEPTKAPRRIGLLLLTCDQQSRRIRFQIGETPRQPSTGAAEIGRAMVRGERNNNRFLGPPLNSRVRFFPDGSFEFLEAIGFSDSMMREFLEILKKLPTRISIVLFKGPDTGAFLRGAAMQLDVRSLDEALANIYGFEGLCYRSPD